MVRKMAHAQKINDPIIVVYGAETPPKSRAEMEALASLPNVVAAVVPHAKLAVHEEFPDEVATTIRSIFCSIRLVEERPLGVLMAEAVALRPTEAEAR